MHDNAWLFARDINKVIFIYDIALCFRWLIIRRKGGKRDDNTVFSVQNLIAGGIIPVDRDLMGLQKLIPLLSGNMIAAQKLGKGNVLCVSRKIKNEPSGSDIITNIHSCSPQRALRPAVFFFLTCRCGCFLSLVPRRVSTVTDSTCGVLGNMSNGITVRTS